MEVQDFQKNKTSFEMTTTAELEARTQDKELESQMEILMRRVKLLLSDRL